MDLSSDYVALVVLLHSRYLLTVNTRQGVSLVSHSEVEFAKMVPECAL